MDTTLEIELYEAQFDLWISMHRGVGRVYVVIVGEVKRYMNRKRHPALDAGSRDRLDQLLRFLDSQSSWE